MALREQTESDLAVASEIGDDLDQGFGWRSAKLNLATLTQGWGGTGGSTPVFVAAPRAARLGEFPFGH
jgi:hypothetical protein